MKKLKEIAINIIPDFEGYEIKKILLNELKLSNKVLTKLKQFPDGITLNGEKAFVTVKVKSRDILKIKLYDRNSVNIVPSDIPLDIIYEDEDILAVNKPRNMPTHPSQNHYTDTLANGVMNYYKDKDFTFRVITRLDRDTSGVVIIAKNKISAQKLSQLMQTRNISKEYIAVCHGVCTTPKGIINVPIARVPGSGILREVNESGKEAVTKYEIISKRNGLCLVKLNPLTGRTHQLRVHMSHIGMPIYGDELYGSPITDKQTLLHCRSIEFMHPMNGKHLTIDAPIPEDIKNIYQYNL